jgi:heparanase 1
MGMKHKALATTFASALALGACSQGSSDGLQLGELEQIGTVDERYQGYNVEMVEVTGGRFWAPYGGPEGERYRLRPPTDLTDARLIALARHLAPALMRVSGTWANNTYLEDEGEKLSAPPPGFVQVLTREQWRNAVAFSKAVDAPLVSSFAVSMGTRGANGRWQPAQAQRLLDLTSEAGGTLYAAEFFNETNIPSAAPEMPQNYTADDYAADFALFREWVDQAAPDMIVLGHGGIGEGSLLKQGPVSELGFVSSEDMASRTPDSVDAVSYHFYGAVSQRCNSMGVATADKNAALSPAWLDMTLADYDFYAVLRDKYEPGKPIWNTETAQAACGGSPWASSFLDSFRYLNQLAVLAQRGAQVVMHNTLAASDYALIDQDTLAPRPNYWAAVLWRRLMGREVLTSPVSPASGLRLFAHCLRGTPGGVAVLALNIGEEDASIPVGDKAQAWVMTSDPLDAGSVQINGAEPALTDRGALTGLDASPANGSLAIASHQIAFVAVPDAANPACE